MGETLNPSPLSRLRQMLRPDWTRTVAARRIAAAGLVLLAAVLALRPDPAATQARIAVAARDLEPGTELTVDDVIVESRSATVTPDGAITDVDQLIGKTLAGPARRGEALTDVRVLGPRLAEAAAGPDARVVPLQLADPALLAIVRAGDVVDVLAVDAQPAGGGAAPRVVARGAVVVLAAQRTDGPGRKDGVVLVALPAHAAVDAAGASLSEAITLTFH
jgi:Flp pilus assembly protein CpaB